MAMCSWNRCRRSTYLRWGARLKGMTHSVAPGAILGVQNGDNQGRFEVVWVGENGTPREGQVGVRCVQIGQNIRKNILYIDDQEHELERRRAMLEAFGYGVHTAISGHEGFEQLAGFHFHAVVLDHPLPDVETADFIDQVQHRQPQAKTVILSTFPGKLPERALALADAFVHKGEKSQPVGADNGAVDRAGLDFEVAHHPYRPALCSDCASNGASAAFRCQRNSARKVDGSERGRRWACNWSPENSLPARLLPWNSACQPRATR